MAEPVMASLPDEEGVKLPPMWIGFAFAFGFLVAEGYEASIGRAERLGPLTLLIGFAGAIYWLFCVHRFHRAVNHVAFPDRLSESGTTYPYSPGTAVARHFIPFYNFYWVFKWPSTMVRFIRENTSVRMASGGFLGLLLFSALLLRALDGFFGLSMLFGVGVYFNAKLRRVLAERQDQRNVAQVFA
jgi:hypothetical protein